MEKKVKLTKILRLAVTVCLLIIIESVYCEANEAEFGPLTPGIYLRPGTKLFRYYGGDTSKECNTIKSQTKAQLKRVVAGSGRTSEGECSEFYYRIEAEGFEGCYVLNGDFDWTEQSSFWKDKFPVKIERTLIGFEIFGYIVAYAPLASLSHLHPDNIRVCVLNEEGKATKSTGVIGDWINEFKTVQLDKDSEQEIFIDGGAGATGAWEKITIMDCKNQVAFYDSVETTGYAEHEFHATTKDLDNDGIDEIIVPSLFWGYKGAASFETWVDIYKWNGRKLVKVSSDYPSYYEKTYIPRLQEIRKEIQGGKSKPEQQTYFQRLQRIDVLINKANKIVENNLKTKTSPTTPGISS